ncbi:MULTISPECIES: aminotransferase class III-fold pyridoxal phosphate-dependent enzyme [unclassified Novosphingobium]|uniref:aminotransferase class III-fold pyridoxal phosphate-dependent enzyme n=1 Tax=unclassified Novosphingobium TaxID=2644732 RepID=UPI00146B6A8C|nr:MULTISPECIES: aminotransferase class III-fold pyridoxal phosphate-dependent enzyme [unclassified Novosphingobium]NMN04311.1 4-aminobutyrate aminotransferase-like enzyme/Ser/Thr protein kinase RdoA (MazF antagonist) [Novosphingobium sp. SG919]NMN85698.1 4-aminobutyrate aminotransferase-like enzyme/Ser/Thr protein kinase RdoA (MazF antagonist) [Novosphingobium sp. SG916]
MEPATISADPPDFALDQVQECVLAQWGLAGHWRPVRSERDQTWHLTCDDGPGYVVKLSHRDEQEGTVDFQIGALAHIAQVDPDLAVPRMVPTHDGAWRTTIRAADGTPHILRLLTYLDGAIVQDVVPSCPDPVALRRAIGGFVARLALALRGYFHSHAGSNRHDWDLSRVTALRPALPRIADPALRALCGQVLAEADSRIYPALARTRHQVVHQDAHMGNLLCDPAAPTHIVGVIDFGDMLHGSLLADLVTAADCFPDADADPLAILTHVTQGFDAVCPLEEAEIDLVYDMCCLRLANTVLVANARRDPADEAPDAHLGGGHKHGAMLARLMALGRAEATRALRRACGFPVPALAPDPVATRETLVAQREATMGRIWHFYHAPLHITRGEGAWLIGADGTRYLDAYNNVPQVGHSHPHVVRAIARQAAALNTNTRYLTDSAGAYAQALLDRAPPGFDVCAFVNSGSEANDLASQIARFATGRQGAVVMEGAYHGITAATVDLSPLTKVAPAQVACLPAPDLYRGVAPDPAESWAAARAQLARAGHEPAFLMIDAALTSNGVPRQAPGYLEGLAGAARADGALVIADEVQAGLGRLGDWWGFAVQGLDSVDVITLGKPVGNGHPLGVVLTRRDLWQAFYAQVEVFSTFGGNSVACAAGQAVLDVIEREDLLARANRVGDLLRAELVELGRRFPLIGDVRGRGMLTGLEFVNDPAARSPATTQARLLVERMRENGVLVGTSGPHRAAFKLRPALTWSEGEVAFFVDALRQSLQSL